MVILKKVYGRHSTSLEGIVVEENHQRYYIEKEKINNFSYDNAKFGSNGKLYVQNIKGCPASNMYDTIESVKSEIADGIIKHMK